MELWDILDSEGRKTGRTVRRGDPMHKDEYHLVVHVWMRNPEGLFLISKRAPEKELFPGLWETTGGSAVSGDGSLKTALKETSEELGISLDPAKGRLLYHVRMDRRNEEDPYPHFYDVWLFEASAEIANLRFQAEEVLDAKWATKEEIRLLLARGEFVPVFDYMEDLFKVGG
jgi:8-oxo-dGTP diphosphatase